MRVGAPLNGLSAFIKGLQESSLVLFPPHGDIRKSKQAITMRGSSAEPHCACQ